MRCFKKVAFNGQSWASSARAKVSNSKKSCAAGAIVVLLLAALAFAGVVFAAGAGAGPLGGDVAFADDTIVAGANSATDAGEVAKDDIVDFTLTAKYSAADGDLSGLVTFTDVLPEHMQLVTGKQTLGGAAVDCTPVLLGDSGAVWAVSGANSGAGEEGSDFTYDEATRTLKCYIRDIEGASSSPSEASIKVYVKVTDDAYSLNPPVEMLYYTNYATVSYSQANSVSNKIQFYSGYSDAGKYTIKYEWAEDSETPEGAKLPDENAGVVKSAAPISIAPSPERAGYVFSGWEVKEPIEGVTYDKGAGQLTWPSTADGDEITFVGKWTKLDDTFKVYYQWFGQDGGQNSEADRPPLQDTTDQTATELSAGSYVTLPKTPVVNSVEVAGEDGDITSADAVADDPYKSLYDNYRFVGWKYFAKDVDGQEREIFPTQAELESGEFKPAAASAGAKLEKVIIKGTWERKKFTVTYKQGDNWPSDATLPGTLAADGKTATDVMKWSETITVPSTYDSDLAKFAGWTFTPEAEKSTKTLPDGSEGYVMPKENVIAVGDFSKTYRLTTEDATFTVGDGAEIEGATSALVKAGSFVTVKPDKLGSLEFYGYTCKSGIDSQDPTALDSWTQNDDGTVTFYMPEEDCALTANMALEVHFSILNGVWADGHRGTRTYKLPMTKTADGFSATLTQDNVIETCGDVSQAKATDSYVQETGHWAGEDAGVDFPAKYLVDNYFKTDLSGNISDGVSINFRYGFELGDSVVVTYKVADECEGKGQVAKKVDVGSPAFADSWSTDPIDPKSTDDHAAGTSLTKGAQGYHLDHWSIEGLEDMAISEDADFTPERDYVSTGEELWLNRTYLAYFSLNQYKVKFDANKGLGSMEDQTFNYFETSKLTKNAFSRAGYEFIGWNTKADGAGTSYTDEQEVKNLIDENDGVVTLYAQWKQDATVTPVKPIANNTKPKNGTTTETSSETKTEDPVEPSSAGKVEALTPSALPKTGDTLAFLVLLLTATLGFAGAVLLKKRAGRKAGYTRCVAVPDMAYTTGCVNCASPKSSLKRKAAGVVTALILAVGVAFGAQGLISASADSGDVTFNEVKVAVGGKLAVNNTHTITAGSSDKLIADETNGEDVKSADTDAILASFANDHYQADAIISALNNASLPTRTGVNTDKTYMCSVDKSYWEKDVSNWNKIETQYFREADNTESGTTFAADGKTPNGVQFLSSQTGAKYTIAAQDWKADAKLQSGDSYAKGEFVFEPNGTTKGAAFIGVYTSAPVRETGTEVYNNPYLIDDPSNGYYKTTIVNPYESVGWTFRNTDGKVVNNNGTITIKQYEDREKYNKGDIMCATTGMEYGDFTSALAGTGGYELADPTGFIRSPNTDAYTIFWRSISSGKISKYVIDTKDDTDYIGGLCVTDNVTASGTSFAAGQHAVRPVWDIGKDKIAFFRDQTSGSDLATSKTVGILPSSYLTSTQTKKAVVKSNDTKIEFDVASENFSTDRDEGRAQSTKVENGIVKIPWKSKELTFKNVGAENANYVSVLVQSGTSKKYAVLGKVEDGQVKLDLTNILDTSSLGEKITVSLYAEQANSENYSDTISAEPVTFDVEVAAVSSQKIVYDLDGGSGQTPATTSTFAGLTIPLADGSPHLKDGNAFSRWEVTYHPFEDPTSELTVRYRSGERFIVPDSFDGVISAKAIYAGMEAQKSTENAGSVVTVRWDANAPKDSVTKIGDEVKVNIRVKKTNGVATLAATDIPADPKQISGTETWNFAGWSTNKDADPETDTLLSADDLVGVKVESGTTYYAIWQTKCVITWDANGGYFDDATKTEIKTLIDPKAVISASDLPTITPTNSSDSTMLFAGYNTKQDGTGVSVYAGGPEVKVMKNMTIYAQWTTASDYWISPSWRITTGNTEASAYQANDKYVNEETGIIKGPETIRSDVAILKEGESNPRYAQVKAEYDGFMKNDNYHLYTQWNGDNGGQDANKWMESRVIQVGEHDGDGSGLTFMSVTSLYPRFEYYTSATHDNQTPKTWNTSKLRPAMQKGGAMYNNFNSSFTSDILAVDKTTHDGYGKSTYTTTSDKLWVVSLGELSGASVSYSPAYSKEGTQYKWFSDMGVSTTNDNYCLACYPRTMDFSMDSQFISWYVMKFVERSPYLRELTAVQTSWSGGDDVTWKAYGIFYKGDNGHAVMTTDNFSYGYPGRVSAITPYSTSGLANDEYTGFSATGSVPVAPAFCF